MVGQSPGSGSGLLLKHGRRVAMPSKSITVRIPVTDIDKARQLAEAKGIGYQTLIRLLLHDALKREERKASLRMTGKAACPGS